MVGLTSLWLPILLAAVVVFIASAIAHMVLPYHRSNFAGLPDEAEILELMRRKGLKPGNYHFPHVASMKECQNPEVIKRFEQGPNGLLFVTPNGPPAMGKALAQWFFLTVVLSIVVAYLTGRTLGPGSEYLAVFRVAGTVTFLAYAGAEPIASIWKGQMWSTTCKHVFDGFVYALLTAGVFGWLWPN
jgi:hypothetical protein